METVRGFHYYQILYIYVWLRAVQFSQNAAFQQIKAPSHITRPLYSFLD